jgi:hypothetical protein
MAQLSVLVILTVTYPSTGAGAEVLKVRRKTLFGYLSMHSDSCKVCNKKTTQGAKGTLRQSPPPNTSQVILSIREQT